MKRSFHDRFYGGTGDDHALDVRHDQRRRVRDCSASRHATAKVACQGRRVLTVCVAPSTRFGGGVSAGQGLAEGVDTSAERADVSSLSASSRFVDFAKLRRVSADVRLMTDVVNVVRSLPEGGDTDER